MIINSPLLFLSSLNKKSASLLFLASVSTFSLSALAPLQVYASGVTLNSLDTQLTSLNSLVDDIKTDLSSSTDLNSLNARINSLNTHLSEIRTQLGVSSMDGWGSPPNENSIQGKIDKINDRLPEIISNINDIKTKIYTILSKVTTVDQNVNSINNNLNGVINNINYIKTKVDAILGKVENIDTNVLDTNRKVTSIETDLDKFHNEFYETRPEVNAFSFIKKAQTSAFYDSLKPDIKSYSLAEKANFFSLFTGEIYPSLASFSIENTVALLSPVNERIRSAFSDDNAHDPNTSNSDSHASDVSKKQKNSWDNTTGFWVTGGLSKRFMASDLNAADLSADSKNVTLGFDVSLHNNFILGAFAGYGKSKVDIEKRKSLADITSSRFGAYAAGSADNVGFHVGSSYNHENINVTRSFEIPFFGKNDLTAQYAAKLLNLFGEISYKVNYNNITFQPFTNVVYSSLTADPYSESPEKDLFALSGESIKGTTTFTTIGLRVSDEINLLTTSKTLIYSTVGWRYAFGDTSFTNSHILKNTAYDVTFDVKGLPIASSTFLLNAGLDVEVTKNISLGVSYNGQIAGQSWSNAVDANLKFGF